MLYLTRRAGEAIIINNAIEVRVLEVRGRTVRLARFLPEATVLREEVFAQVRRENEAAALMAPQDLARVAELGLSMELQEMEPK